MPVPEDKLRLGGMALRNGLLVHGPTHWAAAVRADDGTVKVASGPKPRVTAFDDVPGLRGLVRLGEAFAVIPLVKRGLPEAKLAFENPAVLGVAAGGVDRRHADQAPRCAGTGGRARRGADLARARAVRAARRRAGRLPRRRAQGDRRLRGRRRRTRPTPPKEHERCGSHLMAPMIAANLAGHAAAQARAGEARRRSPAAPWRSRRRPPRSRSSPGASATPTRRSRRR